MGRLSARERIGGQQRSWSDRAVRTTPYIIERRAFHDSGSWLASYSGPYDGTSWGPIPTWTGPSTGKELMREQGSFLGMWQGSLPRGSLVELLHEVEPAKN